MTSEPIVGHAERAPHLVRGGEAEADRAPDHRSRPIASAAISRRRSTPSSRRSEVDAFLSPWYGWLVERLLAAIRPDDETGESAEAPCCETGRGPGSTAEVDFETRREPYPVMKRHVNAVDSEISKVGDAVRRAAKSPGAGAVANDI